MGSERKGPVIDVPSLIVKGGPTDGTVFSLVEGTSILVGSGRLATLQLAGEQIGSAHARITWDDAGISITDNGSMGGTFVNGDLVVAGPLADGDHIAFVPPGSKVSLPKLLVRIPPGTVMITVQPPPQEPLTAPAPTGPAKPPPAPFPKGPTGPRRAKPPSRPPWEPVLEALRDLDWRDPKIFAPLGAVALLLLGFIAVKIVLARAPVLEAVQPAA